MKQGNSQKQGTSAQPLAGLKSWQAAAVCTLLTAVFFRDILFRNAFFWEDFIYQYYAFRNFAAVSLAHGSLPLWNPFTYNGMPFQADIQTALFYIPNLLLTLAAGSGKLYFLWVEILIIAHFVLAGWAMYLFVRDLGLEKGYALFSGVAYMLSGFMIMQLIHETFVTQIAWTPLVLFALRRSILRRSFFWMIAAGLLLGHSILAGSPQFTVYVLLLLLGFFLFELWPVIRARQYGAAAGMSALAAGAIVLALGLTALQLLPTAELAGLSQRAEISFAKSSEGSLRFQQLITLIAPKYFGASGAQGSDFWLQGSYWEYWETCIYAGLAPLTLAAAALLLLKRNRTVLFFALVLLFGLLYAFGDNFFLHSFFFSTVPGFDKFRVPGRMSFYVAFAVAVLSGFGLKQLFDLRRQSPRTLRNIAAGTAAAGVLVYLCAAGGVFQPSPGARNFEQIHAVTVHAAGIAALLSCVLSGLLFLTWKEILTPVRLLLALIAFHLTDMMVFGYDQNNGETNPDAYYQRTAELVNFLKDDGSKELFRVNSRVGGAMILDRNQGMVDRIFLCEGYTPLALQRNYPPGLPCYDLLNAKYRTDVDNQKQTAGLRTSTTYLPRAFLADQDTVIRDETAERSFMEGPAFRYRNQIVLEEIPPVRPVHDDSAPPGTAAITAYDLNRIDLRVAAARTSFLVLSEIWYPGWKAVVDGHEQPVLRADWCLRAIPLTPGDHTVVVSFEPESFHRGIILSAVTLLISLAGLGVGYRKEKPAARVVP